MLFSNYLVKLNRLINYEIGLRDEESMGEIKRACIWCVYKDLSISQEPCNSCMNDRVSANDERGELSETKTN